MRIVDLHCDVLEKLSRLEDANFRNDPRLHSNLERLQAGNVKAQVFAIYIPSTVPKEKKFTEALKQIEVFYKKVLSEPEMVHITNWHQLDALEDGQIGAVLSLEGCDCIGSDLEKLKIILNAGVKIVGLTWNFENEVAFGTSEDTKKGLKPFAKDVIQLLNERNVMIDVAHLNEQGFSELLPLAKYLIASHCNARAICDHPRNLTDQQLQKLVTKGGRVHVVFYPPFIEQGKNQTTLNKLAEHINYLVKLIGVEHVGFGSDFDGMDPLFVDNLKNASQFPNLVNELSSTLSKEEVQKLAGLSFTEYVKTIEKRKEP